MTKLPATKDEAGLLNLLCTIIGTAFFLELLRYKNVSALFAPGSFAFLAYTVAVVVGVAASCFVGVSFCRYPKNKLVRLSLFSIPFLSRLVIRELQTVTQVADDQAVVCLLAAVSGLGTAYVLMAWIDRLAQVRTTSDVSLISIFLASELLSLGLGMSMFSFSPVPAFLGTVAPLITGFCDCGIKILKPEDNRTFELRGLRGNFLGVGVSPTDMLLAMLCGLCFSSDAMLILFETRDFDGNTLWLEYLVTMVALMLMFLYLIRSDREQESLVVTCMVLTCLILAGITILEQGTPLLAHAALVATATSCTCAEMLFPLSEGPFYAVRFCLAIDGTLNGARANQYFQCLGQDLKPIPGLFMGGLDAGGMWGDVYYSTAHTIGVSQGHSVTSGYIAAGKVIELIHG